MYDFRVVGDLDECRETWERAMPREIISDLWGFRACFQRGFRRPACFLVAENAQGVAGLLPLSWIEEARCYGYFPGETWQGKTWLEQNRIPAGGQGILGALLDRCPGPYHLRYLLPLEPVVPSRHLVDEVGYLFKPPDYDYDIENYFQEFSHKSAKRLKREIASLETSGLRYRYDDVSDFDHMVRLNIGRFGARSYFYDRRFRESFYGLMHYLNDNGWLRITAVIVDGEVGAVDMGCVYRRVYTLLAGGTNGEHPGVAKLINLHHMRRGCQERLSVIDFLCGGFSWKELFHLTARPLYLLSNCPLGTRPSQDLEPRMAGHVE